MNELRIQPSPQTFCFFSELSEQQEQWAPGEQRRRLPCLPSSKAPFLRKVSLTMFLLITHPFTNRFPFQGVRLLKDTEKKKKQIRRENYVVFSLGINKSLRQWLRFSSVPCSSWVTESLVVIKEKEWFISRSYFALIWKVFPEFHTGVQFWEH